MPDHARQIVARLGPVTIALDGAGHAAAAQDLALVGCPVVPVEAADAASVGLVRWQGAGDAVLAALIGRAGTLAVESGAGDRPAIDGHLFASGWSRHPADVGGATWAGATATTLPPLSFYRRGGRPAGDVLGRGDPDADALLALLAHAAEKVRPGDEVLVVGEQADAGAAVLGALSRASSVLPIADPASLAGVRVHAASVVLLLAAAVNPADRALLAGARRALRPDGRLMIVLPVGTAGIAAIRDRGRRGVHLRALAGAAARPRRRPRNNASRLDGGGGG